MNIKKKILIIDDEEGVLKMYKDKLDSEGFETLTAMDGKTGIETAKSKKPDLILLDIIMPKYNGLDVLRDMKTSEELKKIPVYLLTNLPEDCSEDKAKELGANGYMVKAQFEPQTLSDTVKKIFDLKS